MSRHAGGLHRSDRPPRPGRPGRPRGCGCGFRFGRLACRDGHAAVRHPRTPSLPPSPQPGSDPALHRLDGPAPSARSPRPLLDIDFGPEGFLGPDGPSGPNGLDGPNGLEGLDGLEGLEGPRGREGALLLGYSPVRGSRGSRGGRASPSKRSASLPPDSHIELPRLALKRARLDPALAVAARPPLPSLALNEPPVSTIRAFHR